MWFGIPIFISKFPISWAMRVVYRLYMFAVPCIVLYFRENMLHSSSRVRHQRIKTTIEAVTLLRLHRIKLYIHCNHQLDTSTSLDWLLMWFIRIISSTLNRLISVRWRLVLEPIVTQNTKCHMKVQLVLDFPLSLFCIVKVGFH